MGDEPLIGAQTETRIYIEVSAEASSMCSARSRKYSREKIFSHVLQRFSGDRAGEQGFCLKYPVSLTQLFATQPYFLENGLVTR